MKTLPEILTSIAHLPAETEIVIIDLFCGAGGFSWGAERATIDGRKVAKVLVCVNHDALAIESHYANMPDAMHFVEDIRTVAMQPMMDIVGEVRRTHPHIKVILHASLECTNHSKAKGGMSRDADSRTLAEHLFRYIQTLAPDYISIENVVEFMDWGPLIVKVVKDKKTGQELYCPLNVKRDKKSKTLTIGPTWVPDPAHKGEYYDQWVANVKTYGYKFDHRVLNSADIGAYTSRKRFFGMFALPQLPISWPEQTHAKNPQQSLFSSVRKWMPVGDVLDFSNEGKSIFDRKKPLVDASLERVYAGLVKFVAGGKGKFIVKYNSMSQRKTYVAPSVDDPCPVVSTQGRLGVASVSFLSKYYSGSPDSKNISISSPAAAITTVDHHSLVSADFISAYYGGSEHNHSTGRPAPTLTTRDRLAYIKPCFMDMAYGNGSPSGVNTPAGAVTTNPKHHLVTCTPWVMNTGFNNIGSPVSEPSQTITADRHWHYLLNPQYQSNGGSVERPCFTLIARMDKQPPYLITASTDGRLPSFIRQTDRGLVYEIYDTDSEAMVKIKEFMAIYGIVDIKMRMLVVDELKMIMGFPVDYVLKGSQEAQKKFIGNAVETTQAKVNIEAFARALIDWRVVA